MKLSIRIIEVSPVQTAQEHKQLVAIQAGVYSLCKRQKIDEPEITVELAKPETK